MHTLALFSLLVLLASEKKKALVKDVPLGIIIKRKTSFMSKEKEGLIQMAVVYL